MQTSMTDDDAPWADLDKSDVQVIYAQILTTHLDKGVSMIARLTDYLDETASRIPDKTAYVDQERSLTFSEVKEEAGHVAQALIHSGLFKKPVALVMDKTCDCIVSTLGIAYSGNFYTIIDTEMPAERIRRIMDTLSPEAIITTEKYTDIAAGIAGETPVLVYNELQKLPVNLSQIEAVKRRILPSDVLYVLFTSGSTGTPKGVITSHWAVVHFLGTTCRQVFKIEESDVMLCQCPFYFVMSLIDMFSPLSTGAQMHMIPESWFSFPAMLVEYIEKNKVTFLNWVPSALNMITSTDAFSIGDLSSITKIIFGGEIMPIRVLKDWQRHLPDAYYLNSYGSTEATNSCVCYAVNREFEDTAILPIGVCDPNMDVFLLDDENRLITEKDQVGELCVRGASLSYGYYKDPERTRAVFVQNPLNDAYEEKIYRTGDLARYNVYGELECIGRKDFQIKHMGHRIELGEIEAAVSAVPGVRENACIYDSVRQAILLYYSGSIESRELGKVLKEKLPAYMLPRKRIRLDPMPHNLNGKIDRAALRQMG